MDENEQPRDTRKPSALIREGLSQIRESRDDYLYLGPRAKRPRGCVDGALYVALGGPLPERRKSLDERDLFPFIRDHLAPEYLAPIRIPGVPYEMEFLEAIDRLHSRGYDAMTARQIADWLESEGR